MITSTHAFEVQGYVIPSDSDILNVSIKTQVTLFNEGEGSELGLALEVTINYKGGKKPKIFNRIIEVPK